jgi:hypothetical protein
MAEYFEATRSRFSSLPVEVRQAILMEMPNFDALQTSLRLMGHSGQRSVERLTLSPPSYCYPHTYLGVHAFLVEWYVQYYFSIMTSRPDVNLAFAYLPSLVTAKTYDERYELLGVKPSSIRGFLLDGLLRDVWSK